MQGTVWQSAARHSRRFGHFRKPRASQPKHPILRCQTKHPTVKHQAKRPAITQPRASPTPAYPKTCEDVRVQLQFRRSLACSARDRTPSLRRRSSRVADPLPLHTCARHAKAASGSPRLHADSASNTTSARNARQLLHRKFCALRFGRPSCALHP